MRTSEKRLRSTVSYGWFSSRKRRVDQTPNKILPRSNKITPAIYLQKFTTDPQIFASVLIDWASISAEMSRGGDSFSSQSESNCDRGWRPLYTSIPYASTLGYSLLPSTIQPGCRELRRVREVGRWGSRDAGRVVGRGASRRACAGRPSSVIGSHRLRLHVTSRRY